MEQMGIYVWNNTFLDELLQCVQDNPNDELF